MQCFTVSNSFTRPADTTAYASGDLVANSTTAGSVVPVSFVIPGGRFKKIHRVTLQHSNAVATNANFKIHFFKDSPTVTNGDNGAIAPSLSNYLFTVAADASGAIAFTGGSKVSVNTAAEYPLMFEADLDHTIYALVEARAAYTPASAEVFTLAITGEAYI